MALGYIGDAGKARALKEAKKLGIGIEESSLAELSIDDPDMANAYAQVLNLKPDNKIWIIPNSMKAYLDFGSYKSGEINGIHKMKEILSGMDINPEYFNMISKELNLGKGGAPSIGSIQKYWREKIDKIDKTIRSVLPEEDSYYTNEKGQKKKVDSKDGLRMIETRLKKNLSYDERNSSEMLQIITGNDGRLVDMNNPDTRARVAEQISRLLTTAQINKDLKTGNKNAKYSMAFILWAGMGEKSGGLADLRDLAKDKAYVFSHNEPIRRCVKGFLEGSWEIKPSNYTTKFVDPKTGGAVSINRSRASQESGKVVSRWEFNVNKTLVEEIAKSKELENSEVLLSYIQGQQKLLEDIAQLLSAN